LEGTVSVRLRIYPTWTFSSEEDIHLTVQTESGEVQLHLEEVTGPGEERLHLEFFMDPEAALAVSAALSEASISALALKDAETPRPN
jgi:hypothetical protein